jgi:ribosomal protein S18 acetylase RimI-like enzyme
MFIPSPTTVTSQDDRRAAKSTPTQNEPMPIELPGQDTLLASWAALTEVSPGAGLHRTDTAAGAVFPAWAALNNVIALGDPAAVAVDWRDRYADAGVAEWALWVPSGATSFDTPDESTPIPGMRRSETTLVMVASIRPGLQHDDVRRAPLDAALRAGEEPVPVAELGSPGPGLPAWVLVREGVGVASAWTCRVGADCGIYAVGTAPAWRRRGLASALMRHLMAGGAGTASVQSTPMGRRLYESLGFVAVGRYEEWVPQPSG